VLDVGGEIPRHGRERWQIEVDGQWAESAERAQYQKKPKVHWEELAKQKHSGSERQKPPNSRTFYSEGQMLLHTTTIVNV